MPFSMKYLALMPNDTWQVWFSPLTGELNLRLESLIDKPRAHPTGYELGINEFAIEIGNHH